MLQKSNRNKILELFFNNPLPKGIGFQLREISKNTNIAPTSVKNYLTELFKEKLIIKEKHRTQGYPLYYANRDNDYFKLLKRIYTVQKIKELGLLEELNNTLTPDCIILFGSVSKGEDIKESDIDIFLQCSKKDINLSKYEKLFQKKINLFFDKNFNKLSKEFKNSLINGIILKGYLKGF